MKVKIVNGKLERAGIGDTEFYTLIVNGNEHNWCIAGQPSDYEFVVVGDKCLIEVENEDTD